VAKTKVSTVGNQKSRILLYLWAAPSPMTEVVTGRFWNDFTGKANSTFGWLLLLWKILGEPEDIHPCKCPAVQLTSPGSITLWSRDLANDQINDQEVRSSTSQVAQEDLTRSYTFRGKI